MADILTELYEIVERRKAEREEGSYTAYLFDAGLDKILKKVGEESAETIIAAKNLRAMDCFVAQDAPRNDEVATCRQELLGEVGDLIYHLVVMLNELGVETDEVATLLRARMQKQGNRKA